MIPAERDIAHQQPDRGGGQLCKQVVGVQIHRSHVIDAADERRTDKTQRLHMPPDQIRRYVERKAIHAEIHKQKNVPVDHANHTITSRCHCTPRDGKTLSPSARLFCKKSI